MNEIFRVGSTKREHKMDDDDEDCCCLLICCEYIEEYMDTRRPNRPEPMPGGSNQPAVAIEIVGPPKIIQIRRHSV